MAKRGAASDLNHTNWDNEEVPEEQGTFQKASEDALKRRIIKTARRRNPIRSEDGEKTSSAFVGFSGFSSTPAAVSTDFSFLKDISKKDSTPKTNGIDVQESKSSSSTVINPFANAKNTVANIFAASAPATPATTTGTNIFGASPSTSNKIVPSSARQSERYYSRLKGLNESVSKWIAQKVEENPLISLQPIFEDYQKYLDDIEKEESTNVPNVDEPADATNVIPTPKFNFNPLTDKNTKAIADSTSEQASSSDKKEGVFKFGAPTTNVSSSGPTFTFGSANHVSGDTKTFSSFSSTASTITQAGSFSFSSGNLTPAGSATLTFPGAKSGDTDDKKGAEENDEDEPPKVQFKPVVEEDHIYTIRCKVFVKKDGAFGDRGVGNLYLKPIENSKKLQLIVRADTNLGNLLLNFILSESVPTKRMGKKDVMLVAIPTADAQPPPTPILLRVKSPEDADNLLEVLEKNKK